MKTASSADPKEPQAWYEAWFNSPYYHILYQDHDDQEAQKIIDRLVEHLRPPARARMLDVACGRGRFSRYLAQLGFRVTGIDLSPANVQFLRQFESADLDFHLEDIRQTLGHNQFDYAFSFFTSFAYFDSEEEHRRALQNIRNALRPNGLFLLDFLNAEQVKQAGDAHTEHHIEGITFHCRKTIEGNYVRKDIHIEDDGEEHHYFERVRLYTRAELEHLFTQVGFHVDDCFGSYELDEFDPASSPRLILTASIKNG